jgi:dihydrofolate reductase
MVLSTTLTDTSWPTARIVHHIDEIRALKQRPGKAVYVVGGPTLLSSLIDVGLLDELRLIVHPVIVGTRRSVFDGIAQHHALELVTAEPAPSARVHLTYRLGSDGATA